MRLVSAAIVVVTMAAACSGSGGGDAAAPAAVPSPTTAATATPEAPPPTSAPEPTVLELTEEICPTGQLCEPAFSIGSLNYDVLCWALRPEFVTEQVHAAGELDGQPLDAFVVADVDPTFGLAVPIPSRLCSFPPTEGEPRSGWSFALRRGEPVPWESAFACDYFDRNELDRIARGCGVDEYVTCGVGPAFARDYLDVIELLPAYDDPAATDEDQTWRQVPVEYDPEVPDLYVRIGPEGGIEYALASPLLTPTPGEVLQDPVPPASLGSCLATTVPTSSPDSD